MGVHTNYGVVPPPLLTPEEPSYACAGESSLTPGLGT